MGRGSPHSAPSLPHSLAVSDTPDGVRAVVGDEQGAVFPDGDSHRAAPYASFRGDEPGHEIFILPGRLPILHRHANHLVAVAPGAVPRPVLGGEEVVVVILRELASRIKSEVQRSRM